MKERERERQREKKSFHSFLYSLRKMNRIEHEKRKSKKEGEGGRDKEEKGLCYVYCTLI